MKTKLPLTEKFLRDLYKLSNKAEDILEMIFPPNSSIRDIMKYRFYGYLKDAWDRRYYREKRKMKFCEFIWKLKNGGYLRTLRVKDKTAIAITSKGMEKLFKIGLKTTNRKKRIDKKWQMILFDIPENKRKIRDSFRKALQYLGYKNLQKSIWVCPYDVEKETKILIKKYNLKPFVELLLVKKIGLG